MTETFYGIYVVGPDGHEERVRGHTLLSEFEITMKRERDAERRAGYSVIAKIEQWDGMKLLSAKVMK